MLNLGIYFNVISSILALLLFSLSACTAGSSRPEQLNNSTNQDSQQYQQEFEDYSEEGTSGQAHASADTDKFDFPSSQSADNYDSPGDVTPVSLPIRPSTLKKEKILAYAPDADKEDSNIPFIGMAGAAKPEPGSQILVSTIEIESNSTPNNPLSLEGRGLGRGWKFALHWHSLIPSANAKALHPCKVPGNYCFPINADGSFEAYLPTLESHENIYATIVDEKGNLSDPVTEKVNQNILWMREKPKDITDAIYSPLIPSIIPSPLEGEAATTSPLPTGGDQGEGALYALTKNIGVKINATDEGLQVVGNHENNYQSFTSPQAEQLAYDPIQKLLATRRTQLDILINPKGFIPPGDALAPLQQSITVPEAESYTVLKTATNGKMYFGIETKPDDEQALRWGRIRYATNPDSPETIVFLDNDYLSDLVTPMTHAKTLTFDIDADGWALVAFEDTLGQTRLRMGFGNNSVTGIRVGGEIPFGEMLQLSELQIYHANNHVLNYGKALVIDSTNNRIAMIRFNHFVAPIPNGPKREIIIEQWINLGLNKSPQSLALNPDKTRAYIANKNDDTLSILTLKENSILKTPTEIQKNIHTFKLGNLIKNKNISIQPNKILYHESSAGDYLVIGSEGLKGAITIPIENLESLAAKK